MDEKMVFFGAVLCCTLFFTLRFAFLSHQNCPLAEIEEKAQIGKAPDFSSDLFPIRDHLDPSKFRLHLKVLTYDRPASVVRCIRSLQNAQYDGDTVTLDVFVDHTFNPIHSTWSRKASERASLTHILLKAIDGLEWTHGDKRVHFQSHNEGIQPQWLEAWWPESLNDFAFIVEDDMEISPLYYRFFKEMILLYYYNSSNFNPNIYGISFQRQTLVPGIGGYSLIYGKETPFLYQLVGTWGQFVFPAPWKQFRMWYDSHRFNESQKPFLDGMKTNKWFVSKGNKLWTPWIIKWAYAENMYNMYLSFGGNKSLTVSHREAGSNFRATKGVDASLLTFDDFITGQGSINFAPMSQLLRLDYCCRVVPSGSISHTFDELDVMLKSHLRKKAVALVMVPSDGYDLARNWLCHLDGLSADNFVLVVTDQADASALASRGFLVHHLTQFNGNHIENLPLGKVAWSKSHVQLVYGVLSLGYDVVLTNPYSIWHDNPFSTLLDPKFDVVGSVQYDNFCESVLGLSSTDKVVLAWGKIYDSWNDSVFLEQNDDGRGSDDGVDDNLLIYSQGIARAFVSSGLNFNFVQFAPFQSVSKLKLTSDDAPVTLTPPGKSKLDKLKLMKSFELWAIDDYDFACKSVTCRKKLSFYS